MGRRAARTTRTARTAAPRRACGLSAGASRSRRPPDRSLAARRAAAHRAAARRAAARRAAARRAAARRAAARRAAARRAAARRAAARRAAARRAAARRAPPPPRRRPPRRRPPRRRPPRRRPPPAQGAPRPPRRPERVQAAAIGPAVRRRRRRASCGHPWGGGRLGGERAEACAPSTAEQGAVGVRVGWPARGWSSRWACWACSTMAASSALTRLGLSEGPTASTGSEVGIQPAPGTERGGGGGLGTRMRALACWAEVEAEVGLAWGTAAPPPPASSWPEEGWRTGAEAGREEGLPPWDRLPPLAPLFLLRLPPPASAGPALERPPVWAPRHRSADGGRRGAGRRHGRRRTP